MAQVRDFQAETLPPTQPRRRRSFLSGWRFSFLMFVAVMGLAGFFAPQLLTIGPIKDWMVRGATAGQPIRVTVGTLHLGWFTPIAAERVTIYDDQGQPVGMVDQVLTYKSLADFASDWRDLGRIRLERPQVRLQLREDGSNVEDVIAQFLASENDGSTPIAFGIEIVDGMIECHDLPADRVWNVNHINAMLDWPSEPALAHHAKLECVIETPNETPGKLLAELEWQAEETMADQPFARGRLKFHADQVALGTLPSFLGRFLPGTDLAGQFQGEGLVEWTGYGATQKIGVRQVTVSGLRVKSPDLLAQDELQLETLRAAGDVTLEDGWCHFEDVVIDSDLAKARAQGTLPLHGSAASALTWLRRLDRDLDVRGEIDVAKLTETLPATLRVRESAQIQEGKVGFLFASREDNRRRMWEGRLETSRLRAVANGEPFRWDQPIAVNLAAYDSETGLVVERLTCQSSFLELEASGAPEKGILRAKGDLDRLVQDLGQFIDLRDLRLSGQLAADVGWELVSGDELAANAKATIHNFEFSTGGGLPWRESQLTLAGEARGRRSTDGEIGIQEGLATLESGSDRLEAKLLQPVSRLSLATPWHLDCELVGDLATWLPRLQPFVSLPGWKISGGSNVSGEVSLVADRIEIANAQAQIESLSVQGGGLFLREPKVQITTAGVWKSQERELSAPVLTVASSSLAVRAENVSVKPSDTGMLVTGDAGYRADVGRIVTWFQDPQLPPQTKVSGMAVGQSRLAIEGNRTQAICSGNVENLQVSTRSATVGASPAASWQPAWDEQKLTFSLKGNYDLARALLEMDKLDVTSKAFNLSARGTAADPAGKCEVDVSGQLAYDWERVSALLRPYTGDLLHVEGQESREFVIRGPLLEALASSNLPSDSHGNTSARSGGNVRVVSRSISDRPAAAGVVPDSLFASSRIGWASANYGGFDIGPAELDAKLDKGTLELGPLDAPVSGGRVNLSPQILLNSQPMLISAKPGLVADKVQITPEMCQTWLKYLAPMVADAAAAEGRFSITLDEALLPASDPTRGNVRGSLVVHEAKIGPGPLSKQLVWLAVQVKNIMEKRPLSQTLDVSQEWLLIPEQKIDVELESGKVHHRGIDFLVKDVGIRTHGYVGLDQSLSLIAEVPVRDEWLGTDRTLQALKGQVIQVPIQGSLTRPQLDTRALTGMTRQVVTGAATKFLENELGRGLDKLLKPK